MGTEYDKSVCINQIQELVVDQLDLPRDQIDENTSFSTLNMDSIDSIELSLEIEKVFDIKISDSMLSILTKNPYMTVDSLCDLLDDAKNKGRVLD